MLVLFSIALLVAQDTARPVRLVELRDAYRIAADNSPRIAAANALSRAAAARVSSARRPPDPQLQLGVMNYALPEWRAMESVGMTQLQAMQMLPLGGKLSAAGRAADHDAEAERGRALEVRWDVRAKVAMAFYELYATDRTLAIDRQTLRLLQDVASVADAMYRAGEGRQADVLRAQLEIARMTQDTVRMAAMRTATLARLSAVLDAPIADATPRLPAFPDSIVPLERLVALASVRPMLQAARAEVQAADARARLAAKEIWPDLAIGIQLGQRAGMAGTERMGSVMIGATVPVFARSRQLRMREETAAMVQMAQADRDAMRAETNAALAAAHADLTRARSLIAFYDSSVLPQAEAATLSALASYRVGRVDFMTLLDNQMGLNRYRTELAQLQAEQGRAWAELEMLIGTQLFDARSRDVATIPEGRTQ